MLVGKEHRTHPERVRRAAVQMQLNGLEQAFQHRGTQTGSVQDVQTGVGGGGVI